MIARHHTVPTFGGALDPHVSSKLWALTCGVILGIGPSVAQATTDGAYGRLEGDVSLTLEVGVSESFPGESLAARTGALYLQSAGVFFQYDDGLGSSVHPLARSVVAGIQIRPLFLARFAEDLEQGPATLDLWLDSIGLGLGAYRSWHNEGYCDTPARTRPCRDAGMEWSTGFELSLLPIHNAPFVGLRVAVRWSLDEPSAAFDGPAPTTLITLSLGYRHLFDLHWADASDRLPP